jgi:thymidylate kinase
VQRALVVFYRELAKHMPKDRVVLVDATGSVEQVADAIHAAYVAAFAG